VREDVYKKYRSRAKEKVDPTLFPQLSILGDGADYQPATSQKLFFFLFFVGRCLLPAYANLQGQNVKERREDEREKKETPRCG
jgi:hypothetical protein